ncbi:MAG: hypothetical protein RR140_03295 [Clostridia bacterium]
MKKLSRVILCFVIAFCLFGLGGCFYAGNSGPNDFADQNTANMIHNLQGAKVCCKNLQNIFGDSNGQQVEDKLKINNFAQNVLENLTTIYGIDKKKPGDNVLFYDSIRYQLKKNANGNYEKINNSAWKWTLVNVKKYDAFLDIKKPELSLGAPETPYTLKYWYKYNSEDNKLYEHYFYNPDAPLAMAMQIVIYEILVGKTPSEFTFTEEGEDDTLKLSVFLDNVDICSKDFLYLSQLQLQFKQVGSYVGFSSADKQILYNYILNSVIGIDIVNKYSGDDGFVPEWLNKNDKVEAITPENIESTEPEKTIKKLYRKNVASCLSYAELKIDENGNVVIKEPVGVEDSFFNPKPFSSIKDYPSSNFFLGMKGGLEHIPFAEYQSFVIMPGQNDVLSELWLSFECKQNISIRVGTRHYNTSTKTLTDSGTTIHNVKGSNEFLVGKTTLFLTPNVPITAFDNNQEIKATSSKTIIETQGAYQFKLSQNGVGGFAVVNPNSKNIKSSYYEVYFDVVKSLSTLSTSIPFKVAISYIDFNKA